MIGIYLPVFARDAEAGAGVSLGVEIDDHDFLADGGKGGGQIDRRRCLADAAFPIAEVDGVGLANVAGNPIELPIAVEIGDGDGTRFVATVSEGDPMSKTCPTIVEEHDVFLAVAIGQDQVEVAVLVQIGDGDFT